MNECAKWRELPGGASVVGPIGRNCDDVEIACACGQLVLFKVSSLRRSIREGRDVQCAICRKSNSGPLPDLTEQQTQVLVGLEACRRVGRSPRAYELEEGLGIRRVTIAQHLRLLQRRGYAKTLGTGSVRWEPTEKARDVLASVGRST